MERPNSIFTILCFATLAYLCRDAFWPISPETRTFRGMAIIDGGNTYSVFGERDTSADCRVSGRRPVSGEIVTISGPFLREQTREGRGPILVFRNCDVIHKWEEGGTIALSTASPCLPKASQISKVQKLLSERLDNEATEFVNDVGGIWLDEGVSVYAGAVDAGSASITVKSTGGNCFVVARALSPRTANSWEQRMPGTGRAATRQTRIRGGREEVLIPAGKFFRG